MKIELCGKDPSQISDFAKDTGYYHVIIAVDKSGSMAGSPMKQVILIIYYFLITYFFG